MKKILIFGLLSLFSTAGWADSIYSSDPQDFSTLTTGSWLFFFQEDGKEYYKTITCEPNFFEISDGSIQAECRGGIGELWYASYSKPVEGNYGGYIISQQDKLGNTPDGSYVYFLTRYQTGDLLGSYAKVVSLKISQRRPAGTRKLYMDQTVGPNFLNPLNPAAGQLTVTDNDPTYIAGTLTIPFVRVWLDEKWTNYKLKLNIISDGENIDFRIIDATEK